MSSHKEFWRIPLREASLLISGPSFMFRLTSRIGLSRIWLFRISAIVLGLALFPVAEGVCHLCDWGRPDDIEDPFVGFSDVHPLFVQNPEAGTYQIARSRLLYFKPDSFAAKKSSKTYRIFCLGGSTVQGRPYSIETSFTNWLRMGLKNLDPSRDYEVVNCGGISYASYRLVPILKECLQHEPDLFIICSGHNEFLEDRQYSRMKSISGSAWTGIAKSMSRLRTLSVVRSVVFGDRIQRQDSADSRTTLKAEVDAMLDYQNGLSLYHRDEVWQQDVATHFESNLQRMVELASAANVPTMLIQPCSNLKDSAPFKSEHRDGISQDDLVEFDQRVTGARSAIQANLTEAIELFEQAIEIDDQYALTQFELGQCYEAAYRTVDANRAFVAAREHDVCPLRMIEPLNQAMRRVAGNADVMFFSADDLLAAATPDGIVGDALLVDHIHPSFRGHQIIAEEIIVQLAPRLEIALPSGWRRQAQFMWKLYLSRLDSLYFLRGRRSLEALTRWTQGKADGPPIKRIKR